MDDIQVEKKWMVTENGVVVLSLCGDAAEMKKTNCNAPVYE